MSQLTFANFQASRTFEIDPHNKLLRATYLNQQINLVFDAETCGWVMTDNEGEEFFSQTLHTLELQAFNYYLAYRT